MALGSRCHTSVDLLASWYPPLCEELATKSHKRKAENASPQWTGTKTPPAMPPKSQLIFKISPRVPCNLRAIESMDGGMRRGFCFPQKGKLRFCGKGEGCRISHKKKFIACPLPLTYSDTGGRVISSHESRGLIHGRWLPKENTHLLGATSIWGQQQDSKIERYSSLTLMWKDKLKERAVSI